MEERRYLQIISGLWIQVYKSRISILSVLFGFSLMTLGQARDFFLDDNNDAWRWGVLWLSIIVFWTIPVHTCARIALNDPGMKPVQLSRPSRFLRCSELWLPRGLGLATCAIVIWAAWATYVDLNGAKALEDVSQARDRIIILFLVSGFFVFLFLIYINKRLVIFSCVKSIISNMNLSFSVSRFIKNIFNNINAVMLVVFSSIMIWALCNPIGTSAHFSRLALVPILLGSWVPPLTLVSIAADRHRVPFLGGALLVLLVTGAFAFNYNDLRQIPARDPVESKIDQTERIGFDEALHKWKAANGCLQSTCPSPILIAAEGGASRAAFQVAGALGLLLDEARRVNQFEAIRARIFAMSGVSGGALGVATVRAALERAAQLAGEGQQPTGDATKPPCIDSPKLQTHLRAPGADWTWRSCLQTLVSGDYLTPGFIGLAFRDWAAGLSLLPGIAFADRSALLEIAMERNFNKWIFGDFRPCTSLHPDYKGQGLCADFGRRPALSGEHWLPLVLLNSTSVEGGRSVVISDLKLESTPQTAGGSTSILPQSVDMLDVMGSCRDACGGSRKEARIFMSTAVVASARFPIVSTAGTLRDGAGTRIARLVDGGYFDNSGLVTTSALARRLKAAELNPLVIHISNSPEVPSEKRRPSKEGFRAFLDHFFSEISDSSANTPSPLLTLIRSRQGHVELEIDRIRDLVGNEYLIGIGLQQIPWMSSSGKHEWCKDSNLDQLLILRDISMSWWLSKPVQGLINIQLCSERNASAIENILSKTFMYLEGKS